MTLALTVSTDYSRFYRCLVSVRNRVAVEVGQVDPSCPKATTSRLTQVSSCNDFECFESVMGLGVSVVTSRFSAPVTDQ